MNDFIDKIHPGPHLTNITICWEIKLLLLTTTTWNNFDRGMDE